MPAAAMLHPASPREEMLAKIGDLSGIEMFANDVLVAIYKRPEKTVGGLFLPDTVRDEDRWQGKVAMIVKMGPLAFQDSGDMVWREESRCHVGDFVFFRPADSWSCTINTLQGSAISKNDLIDARVIQDVLIRGRLSKPDLIY